MTARWRGAVAAAVLILAGLAFWKLRILDSGVDTALSPYGGDLYLQHWPMMEYGFGVLRSGRLPLWNPYQLCGEPFLALPYVGLFYPLNAVYLLFPVPLAIEWETVLHTLIGLFGMWALLRHYGTGHAAALTAAVTFAWSGWLVYNVNQPSLFAGLNWMPFTVLALDAVAAGQGLAWVGLSLVVALQLLRGGAEVLAHALLAASLFGAARLILVARAEGILVALRRGVLVTAAIGAGAGLAAAQLLPTFELVQSSARAPGGMPYEIARVGYLELGELLRGAIAAGAQAPLVTLGMWPLLAVFLSAGTRRTRLPWICAVLLLLLSLSLIPGGLGFRIYHSLPIIGSLFRRPVKFLDLYSLALSILAGLAIDRLLQWQGRAPRELMRQPAWLAAILLAGLLLLWWPWSAALPAASLPVMLLLLLAHALVASTRLRAAVVGMLCLVQAAALFLGVSNPDMRPLRRPDVLSSFDEALRPLAQGPAPQRTYMFADVGAPIGWHVKQGMLNRFNSAADYEALLSAYYGGFFDRVSKRIDLIGAGFIGLYQLDGKSQWPLMDLTGTSGFAALRGGYSDAVLSAPTPAPGMPRFRLVEDGAVRVFSKDGVLPRAYFVARARLVPHAGAMLRLLADNRFDPRREVMLASPPEGGIPPATAEPSSKVEITGYEPERVEIEVSSDTPGFLVLTDLFYPGWRAFADGEEIAIHRANYLFRAVQLAAGRHRVRFEYRPQSFRRGVVVSLLSAAALVIAVIVSLRSRAR